MIFAPRCANILWQSDALLAQLDRVFGYEPKGQGFESLAARQEKALITLNFWSLKGFFFFAFICFSNAFSNTYPKAENEMSLTLTLRYLFSLRIEMGIKVCSDTEIRMSEPFLNIFEGKPL